MFAPVVRQTTFRLLLSIAAKQRMQVSHFDVKTAFLNGSLNEIIYMKQPPGFIEDDSSKVCLLKKSLYGLKQAARSWNEAIHKVLIDADFQQSKEDHCLYSRYIGECWCYVLIYVDDLVIVWKFESQIQYIEKMLSTHFEIKNLGPIKQYLGMQVTQDGDGNSEVCQSNYINRMASIFGLQDAKPAKTPMEVGYGKNDKMTLLGDNTKYQKLIGHLLYVSVNSRPDVAAGVSILAQRVSSPTQEDWDQLKRVVKYMKSTAQFKLKLSNIKGGDQQLIGYADADWAEDKLTRKSNSGQMFFFNGGTISWSCRKQTLVTLSTTEAEFVSLSEACKEALWLRKLLIDMHQKLGSPKIIYEDNQSCLELIKEEYMSLRTKHIDTKACFVKDYVDRGFIKCVYCPTNEMIADLLTKPLSYDKHKKLRERCNVV